MTLYGLDHHGGEVEAIVLYEKLKKIVDALRKLDSFYNSSGLHKFMVNDLRFSSAAVFLREKQVKHRIVRRSPSARFAEIGQSVATGTSTTIDNAADEFALKTYEGLASGSGKKFSYGVIEAPNLTAVRLDQRLESRVKSIIRQATEVAESAPAQYFRGVALETYDGVMKLVDIRGLFPEGKLTLSAGGKEISCVVQAKDVELLRHGFGRRARVTGRAQYDGRSFFPDRIDVVNIELIEEKSNVVELKGALRGLNPRLAFGME